MKHKILIIDDDENILELTKRVLERRGYEIVTHSTGEGIIGLVKLELPHLVILDNLLPGKDGSEICLELKTEPSTRHIPIILATGQVPTEDLAPKSKELRAEGYLTKPFEIDELVQKVEKLLPQENP